MGFRGDVWAKRIFGIVATILLLCVNSHLCEDRYERPTGEECIQCAGLTHAEQENSDAHLATSHGDCHDCCVLVTCHHDSGVQKVLVAPIFACDLMAVGAVFVPFPEFSEVVLCRLLRIDGAPPTGPPLEHGSRGPPAFQFA